MHIFKPRGNGLFHLICCLSIKNITPFISYKAFSQCPNITLHTGIGHRYPLMYIGNIDVDLLRGSGIQFSK